MQFRDEAVDVTVAIERAPGPLRREVAPVRQRERRAAQAIDRTIRRRARAGTEESRRGGGAAERAADAFGRIRELLLQPRAERLVEQPLGLRLGEHGEQRIDTRLDRTFAQQVGAEPVNRADVGLFEIRERRIERFARDGVLRAPPLPLERFAQPQLQLARRFFRERDRHELSDARPSGRQDPQDAIDQLGRFAGARRGLDDERVVEVSGDRIAGGLIW